MLTFTDLYRLHRVYRRLLEEYDIPQEAIESVESR